MQKWTSMASIQVFSETRPHEPAETMNALPVSAGRNGDSHLSATLKPPRDLVVATAEAPA
jgi:hypothetical protein